MLTVNCLLIWINNHNYFRVLNLLKKVIILEDNFFFCEIGIYFIGTYRNGSGQQWIWSLVFCFSFIIYLLFKNAFFFFFGWGGGGEMAESWRNNVKVAHLLACSNPKLPFQKKKNLVISPEWLVSEMTAQYMLPYIWRLCFAADPPIRLFYGHVVLNLAISDHLK